MGKGMDKAIERMQQKDESGLNYVYSQTYNFVYLRAKSILKNEEEIKKLMQKVYIQAYHSSDEIRQDNLYEWLGKKVYQLGCQQYRKRKEREVSFLEMEDDELNPKKTESLKENVEVICHILEQFPDLYQATLFAFYFDYLKVDEIAEMMECSSGTILNRLNYVRRYIKKAMESAQEERAEKSEATYRFSVEAVCLALRKWATDHCLGMTGAQNVYYSICKTLGLQGQAIYLDGQEFAGVKKTIVYYKQEDRNPIQEEIIAYNKKSRIEKRILRYVVGGIVIVFAILIAIMYPVARREKKEPADKKVQIEDKQEEVEEPLQEPAKDEDVKVQENSEADNGQENDADYIFPNSGTIPLTREEVLSHTKEELRLARNEIYARHGAVFGVEELDNYFKSKSWYTPRISIGEFIDIVELSLIEEKNISLIQEVESGME